MPKTKISEFSATPGNNTDIDGINLAEGCAPSGINDAIRELMAQLKDFQTGSAGDSFNGPIGSVTPAAGVFTNLSASGTFALTGDQVQISEGGTGQTTANAAFNALAPSQTSQSGKYLKTDGTNASWDALDISTADITGTLPIANGGTGLTALGTGVQTALGVNTGSAGAFVVNGGALGTPSSGTVTNLTGTASININGTVGATTPTTGAFTTVSASGNITVSGGTANGVAYLNGSKVLTTGSALTFDGTRLGVGTSPTQTIDANGAILSRSNLIAYTALVLQRSSSSLELPVATYTNGSGSILSGGTKGDIVAFGNAGSDGVIFANANTEAMRLTSTGLGIGTSSTSNARLTVGGTVGLITGASRCVQVADPLGGVLLLGKDNTDYSGLWHDATNQRAQWLYRGGVGVTLDSSGNVGIGTTSPSQKLHVASSSATYIQVQNTGNSVNSYYGVDTAGGWMGTSTNHYAAFYTNNTERARITSAGNVGIGTSSPSKKLDVAGDIGLGSGTSGTIEINGSGGTGACLLSLLGGGSGNPSWDIGTYSAPNTLSFGYTVSGSRTERARIDSSGNLLVGTTGTLNTTNSGNYFGVGNDSYHGVGHYNSASGASFTAYYYNSGYIGGITQNGTTAVAYNTSSDYRLKENQVPLTGSGEFIDALKPKTWTWKTDGSKGVGFIAHEVQEVSPGSVVGTKDAVDEEGKPIMQAMEYGSAEFIANIIAELQSLRARVAQLERN